jgi:wyosine [tRNA(Phe)-imidazoG37] synthetase (radical SAM superfamily)
MIMDNKPQAEPADHLANAAIGFGRFKSCWGIQEAVILYHDKILPCCAGLPDSDGKRFAPYGRMADESFDLMAERRQLQIVNQGPESPCAGCELLIEGDWRHVNYRSMVFIGMTTFCNYNCCYCACSTKSPQPPADIEAVMNWLEKWKADGLLHPKYTRINLADGESLLNPLFHLCSDFCLRHGFQMDLVSNCSVASDRVLKLAKAGLLQLNTSLDAGTAETYARIRGVDGLERVWANIARCLEAAPEASKGNIRPKYILLEANMSRREIDAFAERVEQNGIRAVTLALERHVVDMAKAEMINTSKYVDFGGYFLHRLRRVPGLTVTIFSYSPRLNEAVEKRAAEFSQCPDLIAGRVPAEAPRSPLPIAHNMNHQNLSIRTIRRELTRKHDFCIYRLDSWKPEDQPGYFFELAGYFVQDSLEEQAARHPGHEKLCRMAAQARQNVGGGVCGQVNTSLSFKSARTTTW